MTKLVQVLQKKLQSYEEKEIEDEILAGDQAFNQACMQINLSPPKKSTAVSTSSSFTTKHTSNNNSYVTPQHNSHPQQVIQSPSYGISPSHHRPTGTLQHTQQTSIITTTLVIVEILPAPLSNVLVLSTLVLLTPTQEHHTIVELDDKLIL